jgi:ATP-dependent helicase/nuclease subunit A
VLAILDDSAFSDLFGPESLSEAPVAGRVDGRVVSGIVDRLVVTDARVLILDFKTGLVVPETACAAQPTHLRQLAAYRAVLRQAFPGRRIEAGLLFTAAPKLLLAEDKLLDRHWPAAAS